LGKLAKFLRFPQYEQIFLIILSGLGQSRTAVQNKHQYKLLHRYSVVITLPTKLSELSESD